MDFDPHEAWERLPDGQWNTDTARHLLLRSGWSASAADIERATTDGLVRTLDRLFPAEAPRLAQPQLVADLAEETPQFVQKLRQAPPAEKRLLQREARERAQTALHDLIVKWLQFAVRPENAAAAKWILFLSDVYVVSAEKVKSPALLWRHFDVLGQHAFGPAPALTKAVSRSPAMVRYLDLDQNQRGAPNENFARELLELFVLGEGHYTERDIKEAARAFTGYRARFGDFFFATRQHDASAKTVFGATGRFTGDDVIDLTYGQPAAGTFLPQELVKFCLSDRPLPPELLAPLGTWWSSRHYDLRALAQRFFGSRIFFAPEFRGNFIKSPIQFYLGLTQDLALDIAPLTRRVVYPLRSMGQMPYSPPNVRGWVGGRNWINSATLAARRLLVESLFAPIREDKLDADERRALDAARAAGAADFSVNDRRFAPLAALDAPAAADRLISEFLPVAAAPAVRTGLVEFLAADDAAAPRARIRRLRRAAIALLQSPDYQLC